MGVVRRIWSIAERMRNEVNRAGGFFALVMAVVFVSPLCVGGDGSYPHPWEYLQDSGQNQRWKFNIVMFEWTDDSVQVSVDGLGNCHDGELYDLQLDIYVAAPEGREVAVYPDSVAVLFEGHRMNLVPESVQRQKAKLSPPRTRAVFQIENPQIEGPLVDSSGADVKAARLKIVLNGAVYVGDRVIRTDTLHAVDGAGVYHCWEKWTGQKRT